jgi:type I restriction enzyme, S subunit
MSAAWPTRKLCDIADIRVSNVDKKTHASEKPVKLCNYMDVYSNEYVTNGIDFMEASASTAEIERFSLNCGDVIITKDSETPDDIGIPAVISEAINRLVCGYHLALIRPNADQVDSIYLAKQLSTARVARYFSLHASGSTRYGLPISAIESVGIPTPPKPEQTKIAEILSTVDRAIKQTEAVIAKQERIKTGLMQDLLTRGIDEHGNLRSEQTHAFKDSALGRIPVEWGVHPISTFGSRTRSWLRTGPFGSDLNTKHWVAHGVPVLTIGSLGEGEVIASELLFVNDLVSETLKGFRVSPGDIVFSRVADIGRSLVIRAHQDGWIISSNLMRISLDVARANPEFLYRNIAFNSAIRSQLRTTSNSGGRELVNGPILSGLLFPWPDICEQERIVSRLAAIEGKVRMQIRRLDKSLSIRAGLMQDLLSGKRRVTPLLLQETMQ